MEEPPHYSFTLVHNGIRGLGGICAMNDNETRLCRLGVDPGFLSAANRLDHHVLTDLAM